VIEEVTNLKGDASLTIRKQKQIHVFNFEIEVKFKATKVGEEEPWTEGKIKIHEFFNDDDEIELTTTIDKSSDNLPGEFLEKVKKAINGTFKSKVQSMIERFKDEFK